MLIDGLIIGCVNVNIYKTYKVMYSILKRMEVANTRFSPCLLLQKVKPNNHLCNEKYSQF